MRAYYLVDVIDYDVLTFALVADKVGKILRVLYTVAVRDVNQLIFLVVSFLDVFIEKGFNGGFTAYYFSFGDKASQVVYVQNGFI